MAIKLTEGVSFTRRNRLPRGYRRLLLLFVAVFFYLPLNSLVSTAKEFEETSFMQPGRTFNSASTSKSTTKEPTIADELHQSEVKVKTSANCPPPVLVVVEDSDEEKGKSSSQPHAQQATTPCNLSLNSSIAEHTSNTETSLQPPQQNSPVDPSTLHWKFPVSNFTITDSKRAIFLLSMGEDAAKSILVERVLLSIRRRGVFLGPVIVLTDAPFARYYSLTSVDPNLIVLHPLTKDWRWELKQDMLYKRFKTYVLEYLHLDDRLESVELVYYLDIDVVVGQPLQDYGNWD
jgi:hypothetical protein